jgi:1,4-alpha-glucan branching enzyme
MYEDFGFSRLPDGRLVFRLFVPDHTVDPSQYVRGGSAKIASAAVVGDFQPPLGGVAWDAKTALPMTLQPHPHGYLYEAFLPDGFPDGYYQYKYVVTFQNGVVRWVGDPCSKYGGDELDNSAFVVGGAAISVEPLDPKARRSGADLIVYELMLDDFTAGFRGDRAPVDAVVDKLESIQELGINAIEFMPLVAWPDSDSFSWGYDPAFFFSVESAYVKGADRPLDKLARLGDMISACHARGLNVLLDIVLQHASAGTGTRGFPYYWLWQEPLDSPFIGSFTDAGTFGSLPLDYHNACTLQFVESVCRYWAKRFKIDGFRFDQISGFDNPSFPNEGAPALIGALKTDLAGGGSFPLILEDTWDYQVIADTNAIGATHGWFDMFRSRPASYLAYGQVPQPEFLRVLNASRDFAFPIGPLVYVENHDHATVTNCAGGRPLWYRVQPYLIALATAPAAIMVANGQEFGRSEYLPEDDTGLPPDQQRVRPRPLSWDQATDAIGTNLRGIYRSVLGLRRDHAGLRSPNFYPDDYDWQWSNMSPEGYGIDVDKQVVIYHRWGTGTDGSLERFIVVLNFGAWAQQIDVPFPSNGIWTDLLSGSAATVVDYWLRSTTIDSYWGHVFYQAS